MIIVGLVVVIVTLAYFYSTRNFSHWKNKGVKCVKPYPFVGSIFPILSLQTHLIHYFQNIYKKYTDEPFVGFFLGGTPGLVVNDPDVINNIMISDFAHFTDHSVKLDEEANPLIAKQLFFLNGQRWREMRHRLSPTFTSGRMKAMFPLVQECAELLETRLQEFADSGKDINIREINACFFTDVIGSCVFGIKCDALNDPNNQFRAMSKRIYDPGFVQGLQRAFITFMPKVAKLLRFQFSKDVSGFFRTLVNDVITMRKKTGEKRNDFMQLLMELKEKGKVEGGDEDSNPSHTYAKLSDDELLAQAMIFFSAGFETSSSAVSYAVFELAKHPDVQRKAREDIERVLKKHEGVLSYQALNEMHYIDAILQETLRLYPPAPTLNRECTKNYMIPGTKVTIEVGTPIYFPMYAMNHDEKYFPNPEEYNPDRFLEKLDLPSCVNIPFGEGPRQCIAMRFARMQSRLGLMYLLRHFELTPSPGSKTKLEWNKRLFRLASIVPVNVRAKRVN